MQNRCLKNHLFVVILVFVVLYTLFHNWSKRVPLSKIEGRRFTALLPRKDVLIRSVYYDDRARDGHSTMFVFIAVVNKTILDKDWIVGCGVGSHVAPSFRIKIPATTQHVLSQEFPYEEVIVECFDIPAVATDERSAFIKYRTSSDSDAELNVAGSERPVKIPSPYIQPPNGSKYNFTVLVCTKAHNYAVPWLKEFLRYQKTLGVDHVHMNAEATFTKEGGYKTLLKDEFSKRALEEGFITMDVFDDWYSKTREIREIYSHGVLSMYLDCVYRFRGMYDYVFVLDLDDFFTPLLEDHQIHFYVENYCHENLIGSCKFNWIQYYPDCGLKTGPIEDGNVTSRLNSFQSEAQNLPKSLHRISALLDTTFHYAETLMPGYRTVLVPIEVAYVAHIRKNAPRKKC